MLLGAELLTSIEKRGNHKYLHCGKTHFPLQPERYLEV